MAKKKGYFPNNWKAFKDQPADFYHSISYDEFMDWKMAGWMLPSSIACIIREQDLDTGSVKEYVYNTIEGGKKRSAKIMSEGKSEFLVCTHDDIGHMFPKNLTKENTIYDKNTQDGTDYYELDGDEELPF